MATTDHTQQQPVLVDCVAVRSPPPYRTHALYHVTIAAHAADAATRDAAAGDDVLPGIIAPDVPHVLVSLNTMAQAVALSKTAVKCVSVYSTAQRLVHRMPPACAASLAHAAAPAQPQLRFDGFVRQLAVIRGLTVPPEDATAPAVVFCDIASGPWSLTPAVLARIRDTGGAAAKNFPPGRDWHVVAPLAIHGLFEPRPDNLYLHTDIQEALGYRSPAAPLTLLVTPEPGSSLRVMYFSAGGGNVRRRSDGSMEVTHMSRAAAHAFELLVTFSDTAATAAAGGCDHHAGAGSAGGFSLALDGVQVSPEAIRLQWCTPCGQRAMDEFPDSAWVFALASRTPSPSHCAKILMRELASDSGGEFGGSACYGGGIGRSASTASFLASSSSSSSSMLPVHTPIPHHPF